jgi:hypothetical protein
VTTAIALWTIGYHYIGSAVGLPGTDIWSGVDAFIIRMVDYGGLILGLWLCPSFYSALHRKNVGTNVAPAPSVSAYLTNTDIPNAVQAAKGGDDRLVGHNPVPR